MISLMRLFGEKVAKLKPMTHLTVVVELSSVSANEHTLRLGQMAMYPATKPERFISAITFSLSKESKT